MNVRFSENTVRVRLEPKDEQELLSSRRLSFRLSSDWRCTLEIDEEHELFFTKSGFHLAIKESEISDWLKTNRWDLELNIDDIKVLIEKDVKAYKRKRND